MINIFSLLPETCHRHIEGIQLIAVLSTLFLFFFSLFSSKFKIIAVYSIGEYILMLGATQAPKMIQRALKIFQHLHCVMCLTEENASKI